MHWGAEFGSPLDPDGRCGNQESKNPRNPAERSVPVDVFFSRSAFSHSRLVTVLGVRF